MTAVNIFCPHCAQLIELTIAKPFFAQAQQTTETQEGVLPMPKFDATDEPADTSPELPPPKIDGQCC